MIEDIILSKDRKGISRLKKYLPVNFCERAAKYIIKNLDKTVIITGFYVNGTCETDGIPGAISLAKVLGERGSEVTLITDSYCSNVLRQLQNFPVIDFPIGVVNNNYIDSLIRKLNPTLMISIERCGRSKDNRYYNFRGIDITKHTARLDLLTKRIKQSVAIGDTGNEIGMGNLFEQIKKEALVQEPSIAKTKHLVISSISNWGCYGILTYLSKFLGRDFISSIRDSEIIRKINNEGVVDGISCRIEPTVDGYTLKETKNILKKLYSQI